MISDAAAAQMGAVKNVILFLYLDFSVCQIDLKNFTDVPQGHGIPPKGKMATLLFSVTRTTH